MAVHVETAIAEGLLRRLRDADLGGIEITYESRPATGKPPYLETRHFPNRTQAASIGAGGLNRHEGFLQVNVVYPAGETMRKVREKAGAIIDLFPVGLTITEDGVDILINDPAWLMSALIDEGLCTIPVTVPYTVYIPRP